MNQQAGDTQTPTHDQLPRLHNVTKEVSKLCLGQLKTYLEALAPLFRPRRVLGDYIEGAGKENLVSADQNLAELKEIYFRACGRPFDLRRELPVPLESFPTSLQLYEWEYVHEIPTGRERKTITVVSPLTWVLAYRSTYSFSMLRQVMAGKQERDTESIRSFVLRAYLMHMLFLKISELTPLLDGLRYKVAIRKSPQLGELPLVTVSAPFATVR